MSDSESCETVEGYETLAEYKGYETPEERQTEQSTNKTGNICAQSPPTVHYRREPLTHQNPNRSTVEDR